MQFRLEEEMFAEAKKQRLWALNRDVVVAGTCCYCSEGGQRGTPTQTHIWHHVQTSHLHGFAPVTLSWSFRQRRGRTNKEGINARTDGDHELRCPHKNPVCVSVHVVVIVRKGNMAIRLLSVCRLVQIQCVKKLRRRVRGHQVGLKSGCTSPRCATWRLKQWRADSSPALAQGRYHGNRQIDQPHKQTNTHT